MPDAENEDYEKIFGQGGAADLPPEDEDINFDPTEAGAGRLPKDDYFAVISARPEKKISQNGNPMLYVTFSVVGGQYDGSLMWRRYMLSGKAGGWTREFLEAIGCDDEAKGLTPIKPSKLEGRHCIISVRDQKDNPDYQEVWRVKPHPNGPGGGGKSEEGF